MTESTLTRHQRHTIKRVHATEKEKFVRRLRMNRAKEQFDAACKAYGFAQHAMEKAFEKGAE